MNASNERLTLTGTTEISVRGRNFFIGPTDDGSLWTKGIPTGEWEPDTYAILERFVTPEVTYLDLGAFTGPTLLFAASSAKVAYGFEPDPLAFVELKVHLACNPCMTNIHIYPLAIAARTGRTRFGNRRAWGISSSSLLFGDGAISTEVECSRLDEFVAREGIAGPVFIKMDIEGGEFAVLPAHARLLANRSVTGVLFALHPGMLMEARFGAHPGLAGRILRRAFNIYAHVKILLALRSFPTWQSPSGTELKRANMLWNLVLGRAMVDGNMILCHRGNVPAAAFD